MAYKDEYEVARPYTEGGSLEKLARQVDGDYAIQFHWAPPLWAKRDQNGKLRKRVYGPWVAKAFRVLSRLRRVRGTALDIFGYAQERREERALIEAIAAGSNRSWNGFTMRRRSRLHSRRRSR